MKHKERPLLMAVAMAAALSLFAVPPAPAQDPAPAQIPVRGLPLPAGTYDSVISDSNASGESVGDFAEADSIRHAVLWKDGTFTILDSPDDGVLDQCLGFQAYKINAKGQVIGWGWDSSNNYYGFVWKPDTDNGTTGTMVDIGMALDTDITCSVADINDSGQVIAVSFAAGTAVHGFRWDNGIKTVLTWTDPDTSVEYPIDVWDGTINNNGQISGTVYLSSTEPAVRWDSGNATVLTPGANASYTFINSSGAVAGDMAYRFMNPWVYTSGPDPKTIDVLSQYPEIAGASLGVEGFNDLGQVLITATDYATVFRCFVWKENDSTGSFTEIPISGLVPADANSVSAHLNSKGEVAGVIAADSGHVGFFWDPTTPDTVQSLGLLSDCYSAEVNGISDATLISGFCVKTNNWNRAVTWDPNAPPNAPPVLTVPSFISAKAGFPITFTATATDPDANEILTFSMTDSPAEARLNPITGAFSWFPMNPDTRYINITVTDSGELSDTKQVVIEVNPADQQPYPWDLGVIGDYTNSSATAVNASGQIVGNLWSTETDSRAFLWLPEDTAYMTAGMHEVPLPEGYSFSEVAGINGHGEVVGTAFTDDWGISCAFLWLPVDAYGLAAGPHALTGIEGIYSTWAYDINDAGQVVLEGWGLDYAYHGYLWQNGTMTALTRNGTADTTPVLPADAFGKCLNEAGQVIGTYRDPSGQWNHAVLWQNGVAIDLADTTSPSQPADLNEKGEVIGDTGSYSDVFLYLPVAAYGLGPGSNLLHADLQHPDIGSQQYAFAINDSGRIIGRTSPGYESPGFMWVWENGEFHEIASMADSVNGFAINASGQAAGSTDQNAYFHSDLTGFQPLQGYGNATRANDINDASLVVGAATRWDGTQRACTWDYTPPNHSPSLTVPLTVFGSVNTEITFTATATDPDGDTLTFMLYDPLPGADIGANTGVFTWTPTTTGTFSMQVHVEDVHGWGDTARIQVSVWPAGGQPAPTDLGTLPGFNFTNSRAFDVNGAGQVVGTCYNEVYNSEYDEWIVTDERAFVWQGGVMAALPLLAGYTHSRAYAINALGQIAGECDTSGMYRGTPQACLWEYDTNAGAWTPRGLGFLSPAGGTSHNASTIDLEIRKPINDLGQVICISYYQGEPGLTSDHRGFIWQDGAVTELVAPGDPSSIPIVPTTIDNEGKVAGIAEFADSYDPSISYSEAVLWENGGVTRLVPGYNGWANAMNNFGQIVGNYGYDNPFIWLPEAIAASGDLPGRPAGLSYFEDWRYTSYPVINDAGQVLTVATDAGSGRYWMTLSIVPLVGNSVDLGTMDGWDASPFAINASGQVIGSAHLPLYSPGTGEYLGDAFNGFYGSPRTGVDGNRLLLLGGLGGTRTIASAINAGGTIAGCSSVPDDTAVHACIWTASPPERQPPDLIVPSLLNVLVGTPVTFTATASDLDLPDDALTYELITAPDGAAIDPNTGVFTWTPAAEGTVTVEVRVTDRDGFTDTGTIQIDVYPAGTLLPERLGVLPGFSHSYATDINASGLVVGDCFNGARYYNGEYYQWEYTGQQSFVWQDGEMTALPLLPGYTNSQVEAVNAQGKIVGSCFTIGYYYYWRPQACLWEHTDIGWTVTPLGFLGERDSSQALAINAAGLVVGQSWTMETNDTQYVLWRDGVIETFSNLPDGYPYLQYPVMNDSGTVIGIAGAYSGDSSGPGVLLDPSDPTKNRTWPDATPLFINASGQVAGIVLPRDPDGTAHYEQQYVFLWDPATPDVLPSVGTPVSTEPGFLYTNVYVYGLSDEGDILVCGTMYFDTNGDGSTDSYTDHAWVYSNGEYGKIADYVEERFGWAVMSPAGFAAGYINRNRSDTAAFFWDGTSAVAPLPGLGGDETYAVALNDLKQVAGQSLTSYETMRAVVWRQPPSGPTLGGVPASVTIPEMAPYTFTADATHPNPSAALTFSLTDAPEGAAIDSVGVFTWTPTEAQGPGVYTFTVTVTDDMVPPQSDSKTITITVTEVNQAPVLTVPSTLSGVVGTAVTFTASATDPDPHPTRLTYSLDVDAPSGATIDPATGDFTWTPASAGSLTFHVIVTDSGGLSDTEPVTVTVTELPSTALSISVASVTRSGKAGVTTVRATITNLGRTAAADTVLTAATLAGSGTTTRLPLRLTTIKPKASKTFTLQFKGVTSGDATLDIKGSCSLGPISYSQTVTVP